MDTKKYIVLVLKNKGFDIWRSQAVTYKQAEKLCADALKSRTVVYIADITEVVTHAAVPLKKTPFQGEPDI